MSQLSDIGTDNDLVVRQQERRIRELEAALRTMRNIFENQQMSTPEVARQMLIVALCALKENGVHPNANGRAD